MPSRVEDYEVLLTIGSGSYGWCQKIRRKSDGKILVWKQLDYGEMGETEKDLMVSEVNLLKELKHPNIVRYYNYIIDRSNTRLYIVMEHCEGGDLASLISRCIRDRRYLEEAFIRQVMAQLTLALRECHRRSDGRTTVLHRDLKPANIFLDSKNNVKLGDFGLARILNHRNSFADTIVGTPYYMSPEQMNRMSYNEKSDIWSLGCLLYELCALSPPFTAINQKELAEKIREGRFKRIPYRYSEELNSLLCKMLHLKDYQRPSVESILQCNLLSGAVAEEQRRAQEKVQEKAQRRSAESACPQQTHSTPQPTAAQLQLREQAVREHERAVRERERALKEREEREERLERLQRLQSLEKLERLQSLEKLERLQRLQSLEKLERLQRLQSLEKLERLQKREQKLCVLEQLVDEKLAQAESIIKTYNRLHQRRELSLFDSKDSPGKKKVHFWGKQRNP